MFSSFQYASSAAPTSAPSTAPSKSSSPTSPPTAPSPSTPTATAQPSRLSRRWLFAGDNLTGKLGTATTGSRPPQECAIPTPVRRSCVCCDFMNYLFHLDNLSDDMDASGTTATANAVLNALYNPAMHQNKRVSRMTKDYWQRLIRTGAPGTQQRFIEAFDFFYANNLDIPDEVMDHPIVRALGEATNDLVTWSNDAVDFVGTLCKHSIDRLPTALPLHSCSASSTAGAEVARQVDLYVSGLADWIIGSLHWSFESEGVTLGRASRVKRNWVVQLLLGAHERIYHLCHLHTHRHSFDEYSLCLGPQCIP
ncbi:hypothetical protein HGRIS_000005 [Hohenbuehelia grisea]|uniref:Uncharacterized protein n=1 Tax=Hohenbuehelia grisea TaxID=104357 RepID=A0ABR3JRA6_9AGAR